MTMTPIERACIAVIDNLSEQGGLIADCGDPEWAQVDGAFRVEPVVRAVLAAVREPSEAMHKAAEDPKHSMWWFREAAAGDPEMHREGAWHRMIDAALQEG